MTEKAIADGAVATGKAIAEVVKKVWSVMDAAAQKETPTEYLSSNAVQAIQGVAQPTDK